MSKTAKLMNARGRVTLHLCVLLEMRGTGQKKGIYPIFECTETASKRSYGCLRAGTTPYQLNMLFPGVEMVYAESDDRRDADPGAAVAACELAA